MKKTTDFHEIHTDEKKKAFSKGEKRKNAQTK